MNIIVITLLLIVFYFIFSTVSALKIFRDDSKAKVKILFYSTFSTLPLGITLALAVVYAFLMQHSLVNLLTIIALLYLVQLFFLFLFVKVGQNIFDNESENFRITDIIISLKKKFIRYSFTSLVYLLLLIYAIDSENFAFFISY
jgi:hypothetical protein